MRRFVTVLLLIGGLNYGFVGLFDFNPIELLFEGSLLARLLYSLIGLGAFGRLLFSRRSRQRRLNIGPIGSSNS